MSSAERAQDKSSKALWALNKISPVYILLCKQIYNMVCLNYANSYHKPLLAQICILLHEHNTQKYVTRLCLNDKVVMF